MVLKILLALLSGQQSFVGRPDLTCAGGATISFEHGSARINTASANRLERFIATSRLMHVVGFVTIQSDGRGGGGRYDAALSLRRSEAIRSFLLRRNYEATDMNIVAGGQPVTEEAGAIVSLLIPSEDYLRRFPGVPLECF